MIFLVLHNSGLRIGDVLDLKVYNVDTTDGLIDASQIHQGETKHSWFSCITQQTCALLDKFVEKNFDYANGDDMESLLFSTPTRTVQQDFKDVSSQLGIEIHPHLSEPSLLTDVQKLESKTSTLMLSVAESQKEYWQNIILHILKMQEVRCMQMLNHFLHFQCTCLC